MGREVLLFLTSLEGPEAQSMTAHVVRIRVALSALASVSVYVCVLQGIRLEKC